MLRNRFFLSQEDLVVVKKLESELRERRSFSPPTDAAIFLTDIITKCPDLLTYVVAVARLLSTSRIRNPEVGEACVEDHKELLRRGADCDVADVL